MVIVDGGVVYECPYCGDEYKTYEDADTCAEECVCETRDDPIEKGKDKVYTCEYCDKEHNLNEAAKYCEDEHVKNKDIHFIEKEEEEARERLYMAGTHADQYRLVAFTGEQSE